MIRKLSLLSLSVIVLFSTVLIPGSSVFAAEPIKANAANNQIIAPENVVANKFFTLALKGDRDLAEGVTTGDEKYVPNIWKVNDKAKSGITGIGHNISTPKTYSAQVKLPYPGKYTITGEFNRAIFKNPGGFGWYWIEDYNAIDFKDKKYKAINVKGTLKFNTNKGKLKKSKKTKVLNQKQKVGKLPKPTRKGYKFTGWYTKKTGGKKIKSTTKINFTAATKTVYAHWKKDN